jgi:hypothetical protein
MPERNLINLRGIACAMAKAPRSGMPDFGRLSVEIGNGDFDCAASRDVAGFKERGWAGASRKWRILRDALRAILKDEA